MGWSWPTGAALSRVLGLRGSAGPAAMKPLPGMLDCARWRAYDVDKVWLCRDVRVQGEVTRGPQNVSLTSKYIRLHTRCVAPKADRRRRRLDQSRFVQTVETFCAGPQHTTACACSGGAHPGCRDRGSILRTSAGDVTPAPHVSHLGHRRQQHGQEREPPVCNDALQGRDDRSPQARRIPATREPGRDDR